MSAAAHAVPRRLFAVLSVAALAASLGCAGAKPVEEKKEEKAPVAEVAKPPPEQPKVDPAAAAYKAQGQAELDAALARLKGVTVFFNFDDATLTQEAKDRLAAVGDVLNRHPELDVRIEGNADERGTSQYNLALGQRRADEVKHYLAKFGVQAHQIKAISFGAEKPADPGHTEEAWAKNRRADLAPTVDEVEKAKLEKERLEKEKANAGKK